MEGTVVAEHFSGASLANIQQVFFKRFGQLEQNIRKPLSLTVKPQARQSDQRKWIENIESMSVSVLDASFALLALFE